MDPSSAAIKAMTDLTVIVTKLATSFEIQGKQVSTDIAEIKSDIKEIKSDSVTRTEFSTFHANEFIPLQQAVALADKKYATSEALLSQGSDIKDIKGLIIKAAGLIIGIVITAVVSLVIYKH